MINITIIGAGNIGTYLAAYLSLKECSVTLYTSKPDKISEEIIVQDLDGNIVVKGKSIKSTSDISSACKNCDIMINTHPSFMFDEDAKNIEPFINRKTLLGFVPGFGGPEFVFQKCIDKGVTVFGLQRVPIIARLIEYGKSVCADGKKDSISLSCIPASKSKEVASLIGSLLDIKCNPLPNYLCVTMTPSNPILHTTRLATLFNDYVYGKEYSIIPLFYGSWSDNSSELLIKCDQELQVLLRKIESEYSLDLSSVKSLKEHYESNNENEMTKKLCSIKSLHNILSPMIETKKGWIPDFSSRYFTADFPLGLGILESFADLFDVDIPFIKQTMNWYRNITKDYKHFSFDKYGLKTKEEIIALYLK